MLGRFVLGAHMTQQTGVATAIQDVLKRVAIASEKVGRQKQPRLVAVSKTKPVEMLKEAYDAGQRDFGENYVQEIVEKAPQLPEDIRWHFIGHLQSNKTKTLIDGVPQLAMLETVDSTKVGLAEFIRLVKLANRLDSAIAAHSRPPLPVLVQVNTSGEGSKFGVEPDECTALARHIHDSCKNLRFAGLMTIGNADYTCTPENFKCLADCRERIGKELGLDTSDLELSMGMSGDFEQAIAAGSTNVRVGSTIFGARDYQYSKPKDS